MAATMELRTLPPPRTGVSGRMAGERDDGETAALRRDRLSATPSILQASA